jgi:hypothetical protein
MIQLSMEPIRAEAVIASASEAIHCHRAKKEKMDCFVASTFTRRAAADKPLLAMTSLSSRYASAIPWRDAPGQPNG